MSGLIGGKRVTALLKSILGNLTFDELKYNFACVATDITTGEQVVLHDGSLIEAVRASISLPGIFTPVEAKGQYLVDGGLVNEVPVSVCRQMGADFVIGVNVIPEPSKTILRPKKTKVAGKNKGSNGVSSIVEKKLAALLSTPDEYVNTRLEEIENGIDKFLLYHATKIQRKMFKSLDWFNLGKTKKSQRKMPSLIDVLTQTLTIAEYRVAIENLKMADLAISPEIEDIGFWQFDRAAFAIAVGERAAKKAIKGYR
jgi:NTE family protein